MAFTPRERAVEYLRELGLKFSEWMYEYEEFEELEEEYADLLPRLEKKSDAELSESEFDRLNDNVSELFLWAEELESLNAGKSRSRNMLLDFIGGVEECRWEIYYPVKTNLKALHPLNHRPIGDEKIRFDIHKDGDLNYVKIIESEINYLHWNLFKLEIDNQPGIFVGSIPAWQLELVCNVPALESEISKEETSRRILDSERSKNQWQRQINKKTRESIAMFFKNNDSFFANPVIIHDPKSEYIDYEIMKSGVVHTSIDLSFISHKISTRNAGSETIDSRPLTIIDGQHRIRGASLAPTNYDQRLLVVLLPKEISESTAGKLFAEINTLSNPLKDKHRMFLSHRFGVSSPNPKFSFSKFNPQDGKTTRSRANRMSYEFAARLSIDDNSLFLKDKIRFLDQNPMGSVVDIEKWVEYTYGWFQNYPYTSQQNYSEAHILSELSNYFEAWHSIIGKNNWEGEFSCLFRSSLQFRVILKRFKDVYIKAKTNLQKEDIVSLERFKQVLSPLSNIPFTNKEIYSQYDASGEDPWKLLDAWVQDALKNGVCYSEEEILDKTMIGIPGAGIISPPLSSDFHQVDIPSSGLFPSKETKYIEVHRPLNCGLTCKIRVGEGDRVYKQASINSKQIVDKAKIPIRKVPQIMDIKEGLYLELEWFTIDSSVIHRIQIN